MRIDKGETYCYIPAEGQKTIQYGVDTDGPIEWSLSEGVIGVSIDQDGLLTMTSDTDVSQLPGKEKIIFIQAVQNDTMVNLNFIICYEPNIDSSQPPTE